MVLALIGNRYGAHLDDAARTALGGVRGFPPASAARNPLTRNLGRRLFEADWRATLDQLDFPYTLEDAVIAGVPCVRYRADYGEAPSEDAPILLYLHAGGFIAGTPHANAAAVIPACRLGRCLGVGVGYSRAPERAFPTQLEEIERVYLALRDTGRPIVLFGDSAGGALALSSVHRWRARSIPLPRGVIVMSPVGDARAGSDSYHAIGPRDPVFGTARREGILTVFELYAGGADLDHPEISPLAGSFAGFPPLLVCVGAREILLGDSARIAEKALAAGVDASLRVFDGMFHLFHMHWSLAEARLAQQAAGAFIRRVSNAA